MEKKINDLKRVLQQFSLIAQQLLKENAELRQQCSDQLAEIHQLEQSNSDLQLNIRIMRDEKNTLTSECASLREKAEQKEQVKKKKEALVSENADLKSQVDKLQAKVKELEAELKHRDNDFYTSVSAMLQSIQERCNDNGTVVASIKSQISGSFSMQTQESSSEAIEMPQDDEPQESGRSNNSTDDNSGNVSESPVTPSNDGTNDSSNPADENNVSNNGGLHPIDNFQNQWRNTMGNKIYVGIDLGTTNTLVAYEKNGKRITTLPFIGSGNVLPSVLYLDPETQAIEIGLDAYRNGNFAPENRIKSSKTFMGREKVYELPVMHGNPITMSPTEVAAEILKTVKERIIKKLKLNSDDEICAVITVPAAFSAIQKEETKKAAEMAGLTCLGLRPEPVAAAIAGAEGITANSMVFVVDIGGGTYDTAVVYLDDNLNPEIVSQEGDRELGGDDFDNIIFKYLLEKVGDELGIDLSDEQHANIPRDQYLFIVAEIRDGARKAKEELSNVEEYYVKFEKFIIDGYNNNEPVHLSYKITRDRFNSLCKHIYARIEERLDKSIVAFQNTGHSMDSITHLVLVGGSCYIPAVIELCERKVGKQASAQCDKTTAVAEGAGIMAKNWTTVGEGIGGLVAQSMGIKIAGEKFSKIVEKGTKYPCKKTEPYTTTYDNQTSVRIDIYFAAPDKEDVESITEHEYYGFFTLDNIQRAKAGIPQIDVAFDFDSSEQLTVTATDLATGSTNTLIVDRNASHREESPCEAPMAIDLLIDVSWSMNGKPLLDAKSACTYMISRVVNLSIHQMGVSTFSNNGKSICKITSDMRSLLNCLDSMVADSGTNMMDGIDTSYKKLLKSELSERIIILMTDGEPNRNDRSEAIAAKIRRDNNVRLAVIYIGSSSSSGYTIAQNVAAANAKAGETPLFYTAKSMSELGKIFQRVYTDITTRN